MRRGWPCAYPKRDFSQISGYPQGVFLQHFILRCDHSVMSVYLKMQREGEAPAEPMPSGISDNEPHFHPQL